VLVRAAEAAQVRCHDLELARQQGQHRTPVGAVPGQPCSSTTDLPLPGRWSYANRKPSTGDPHGIALPSSATLRSRQGVSFIVTNIPADHADLVGLQAWFRNRTSIEERFREGKHGAGLNHLPSADAGVNAVWTWARLLAGAMSVMLPALTELTSPRGAGRMRIATLRHHLLAIPGRLTRHAHEHLLHLPPHHRLLPQVLTGLRALPTPT